MAGSKPYPSDLKAVIAGLRDELVWIHSKWKIFIQLYGKNGDRLKLLNRSGQHFFAILQDSLRNDLFISIGRLIDPPRSVGRENLSLQRLRSAIEGTGDPVLIKEVLPRIDALLQKCGGVKDYRNRKLAHSDFATATNPDQHHLPGIRREEMDAILAEMRSIMDRIQHEYEGAITAYEHIGMTGDADLLLQRLREAQAHADCMRREVEQRYGITLDEQE